MTRVVVAPERRAYLVLTRTDAGTRTATGRSRAGKRSRSGSGPRSRPQARSRPAVRRSRPAGAPPRDPKPAQIRADAAAVRLAGSLGPASRGARRRPRPARPDWRPAPSCSWSRASVSHRGTPPPTRSSRARAAPARISSSSPRSAGRRRVAHSKLRQEAPAQHGQARVPEVAAPLTSRRRRSPRRRPAASASTSRPGSPSRPKRLLCGSSAGVILRSPACTPGSRSRSSR